MVLVFGGVYQGKLDFVKNRFGIEDQEVLDIPKLCSMAIDKNDQDLNYAVDSVIGENAKTAKCIYGLDTYIRLMVQRGLDTDKWIRDIFDGPSEEGDAGGEIIPIVIINDVSQGLVPMDSEERSFREANGRAMIALAKKAEEIYRVFCGIATKIK